jgi:hypothetical protein
VYELRILTVLTDKPKQRKVRNLLIAGMPNCTVVEIGLSPKKVCLCLRSFSLSLSC